MTSYTKHPRNLRAKESGGWYGGGDGGPRPAAAGVGGTGLLDQTFLMLILPPSSFYLQVVQHLDLVSRAVLWEVLPTCRPTLARPELYQGDSDWMVGWSRQA